MSCIPTANLQPAGSPLWLMHTQIFALLLGTHELLTSFDAVNLLNPEIDEAPPSGWLHVDQSPQTQGLACLQGLVNLAPVSAETSGKPHPSHPADCLAPEAGVPLPARVLAPPWQALCLGSHALCLPRPARTCCVGTLLVLAGAAMQHQALLGQHCGLPQPSTSRLLGPCPSRTAAPSLCMPCRHAAGKGRLGRAAPGLLQTACGAVACPAGGRPGPLPLPGWAPAVLGGLPQRGPAWRRRQPVPMGQPHSSHGALAAALSADAGPILLPLAAPAVLWDSPSGRVGCLAPPVGWRLAGPACTSLCT